MTAPALRRLLAKFDRTVAKNAEQRGKFPEDPAKYGCKRMFAPLTAQIYRLRVGLGLHLEAISPAYPKPGPLLPRIGQDWYCWIAC